MLSGHNLPWPVGRTLNRLRIHIDYCMDKLCKLGLGKELNTLHTTFVGVHFFGNLEAYESFEWDMVIVDHEHLQQKSCLMRC